MRIGLLPLYIKLYDDTCTGVRPRLDTFYETVAAELETRGLEVERTAFCRIKPEFDRAVAGFEEAGVDAIVTLHMAYSPSLEAIDALTATSLPIIVLDTTETLEFTPQQDPGEIMYNHGIHGVMDLCSMLKRHGKAYAMAAGHYLESDCVDRVCGLVRAAVAAGALGKSRVCLVGGAFEGMGDFTVEPAELKERFGILVEEADGEELGRLVSEVTEEEIAAEWEENRRRFDFSEGLVEEEYETTLRNCLGLRKYIEKNGYSAFSVNFLKTGGDSGLGTMPFIECSKAMERGLGYAGEGDGLTAAFTGAFLGAYPETSFVEIFCPDWKNDLLFLSHMGEVNYGVADTRPLVCRAGANYSDSTYPYPAYARMKGGKAVYVNISRDSKDYQLLAAPVEMLEVSEDRFPGSMRGWMRPEGYTTARFLELLSENGATHHSSLIYGARVEELAYFGRLLGMKTVIL